MSQIALHPGPRLVRQVNPNGGAPYEEDITEHAILFLFDRLELTDGVRACDLFDLFERCPALKTVYRRLFVEELCAEATLGPLPHDTSHHDVPRLEFRQSWDCNSRTRNYTELRRFVLMYVDYPPEDNENTRPDDDGLVRYSMVGSNVRPILHLPVRLNTNVRVFETDRDSPNYYRQMDVVQSNDVSLGDVLQALLWDLTWFGSPEDTQEMADKMAEISRNPEAWSPA